MQRRGGRGQHGPLKSCVLWLELNDRSENKLRSSWRNTESDHGGS